MPSSSSPIITTTRGHIARFTPESCESLLEDKYDTEKKLACLIPTYRAGAATEEPECWYFDFEDFVPTRARLQKEKEHHLLVELPWKHVPVSAMRYLPIEDPNAAEWTVAVLDPHTQVLLSVESAMYTNNNSLIDDDTTAEVLRSFRFQLRCWESLFGYMCHSPQLQRSVTQCAGDMTNVLDMVLDLDIGEIEEEIEHEE